MRIIKKISWKKVGLGILAFFFLSIGGVLIWAATIELPDISTFEARKIANSSKITDRTGEVVLYDIHQSVRRTEIPLDEMGENIKNAVISIEDKHFYSHKGIRPTSIVRAVFVNILQGSFSQGGSTITQQIIKNTLLNTKKTVARKFKEWILAIKLERQFSKDQILQIYLNDAPFGSTIYGVEEASQAFFNKTAKDLSVSEASYLAAMVPAPSYYSPFGKNRAKLDNRKKLVLNKMKEYGYITPDAYEIAKSEKVTFNASINNSIKAPHFVFYILDYLEQKYGKDVMESGGYTIKTTLDYELQEKAEEMTLSYATQHEKKYRASNSSLVAIDPTTGQILTMVGSRNYFDKTIDGAFNVATAERQPGSSFKPFVYGTAFAKGYTPETILFDVPTEFSTNCTSSQTPLADYTSEDCYNPSNFDDKFKGPLSLRSSIAQSRNIPSVKLLYLVGIDNVIATAHSLGITTLNDRKAYGLSLVLGGGEITLLDITSAYGVFANSGVRNQTNGILEIRDRKGNVIEEYEQNATQVMDKNAVLTLNDVLSDTQARAPTFANSITIPGVAVKTGTTNEDKDAWIIGYSPNIAVGVWSGNNDNKSMTSGGATVSGPLWKSFMETVALKKYPVIAFEKPLPDPEFSSLKPVLRGEWMGNEIILIDKFSGLRATENTPPEARVEKIITSVHDILYWVNKKDPRGPIPSNPNQDPQFRLWDASVQSWWENNKSRYIIITTDDIPSDYETLHSPQNNSKPTISGLPSQMIASDTTTITIKSESQYPLTNVDVFVDNTYITTLASPFRFVFTPKNYGFDVGSHVFKIVSTNSIYTKSTIEETLELI